MNSTPAPSLAGLGQMIIALDARRSHLLHELRQAERDLETIRQAWEVAMRLGFSASSDQPAPTQHDATHDKATPPLKPSNAAWPNQSRRIKSHKLIPDTTLTMEALRVLNSVGENKDIPPKADKGRRVEIADAPLEGADLQAIRDSVQEIARKAAAAPPGPGGRRSKSARGLVPGEPIAPSLLAVLRAADRPLTSHEAAVAMLEVRGLRLEGQELAAVTNRASALLSQQVATGRVHRLQTEGLRQVHWVIRPESPNRLT